jgi:hypothetical protein
MPGGQQKVRLRCLSATGGSWSLNAPLDTVRAGGRLSPVTDRWKTFLDCVVAKITRQLPPWLPPDRFMAAWATAVFRINHLVVEASGLAVLDEFEGPEVAFGDHGHVAALLDLVEGGGLCRTQGASEDRGQQQGGEHAAAGGERARSVPGSAAFFTPKKAPVQAMLMC